MTPAPSPQQPAEPRFISFLEQKALSNQAILDIYTGDAPEDRVMEFIEASRASWTVHLPSTLAKLESQIVGPYCLGDDLVSVCQALTEFEARLTSGRLSQTAMSSPGWHRSLKFVRQGCPSDRMDCRASSSSSAVTGSGQNSTSTGVTGRSERVSERPCRASRISLEAIGRRISSRRAARRWRRIIVYNTSNSHSDLSYLHRSPSAAPPSPWDTDILPLEIAIGRNSSLHTYCVLYLTPAARPHDGLSHSGRTVQSE